MTTTTTAVTVHEYRITFGMRYRTDTHPYFPAAHPDGYLAILAPDEEIARAVAHAVLDFEWAFIYAAPFDALIWQLRHPLGELGRIDLSIAQSAVTS